MFDEQMPEKKLKLSAEDLRPLAVDMGQCVASDRITVEGAAVGYMYREEPAFEEDSGWRFLAGDETDAYLADDSLIDIHDLNLLANHAPEIVPLLGEPAGTTFVRDEGGHWQRMEGV